MTSPSEQAPVPLPTLEDFIQAMERFDTPAAHRIGMQLMEDRIDSTLATHPEDLDTHGDDTMRLHQIVRSQPERGWNDTKTESFLDATTGPDGQRSYSVSASSIRGSRFSPSIQGDWQKGDALIKYRNPHDDQRIEVPPHHLKQLVLATHPSLAEVLPPVGVKARIRRAFIIGKRAVFGAGRDGS